MMKVGVIGVGAMGQNHARVYSEIADLVGVTDAISEQATKIAARLGTKAYSSVDDLLTGVDAVSICTPTSYHFDTAMKAISKGKHLLVEKPFTGDSEKAAELCRVAEKNGVTIASGFIERCNPIVSVAKETMGSGKIGKIISLASRRVSSFPARIRDVGVVMDLGIHDVDVMRHITSSNVISVYAVGGNVREPKFEDYANLLMEFENDASRIRGGQLADPDEGPQGLVHLLRWICPDGLYRPEPRGLHIARSAISTRATCSASRWNTT